MRTKLFPGVGIGVLIAAALLFRRADAQDVTINLAGQIPTSCRLSGLANTITLGAVSAPGSTSLPFQVRCNTPFTFAVTSSAGALKTDAATPSPGFTAAIPYTVELNIPTNIGAIAGSCTSAALKQGGTGCSFPSSGQGVALAGDASLLLSWQTNAVALAGAYTDTLTLSVGPLY